MLSKWATRSLVQLSLCRNRVRVCVFTFYYLSLSRSLFLCLDKCIVHVPGSASCQPFSVMVWCASLQCCRDATWLARRAAYKRSIVCCFSLTCLLLCHMLLRYFGWETHCCHLHSLAGQRVASIELCSGYVCFWGEEPFVHAQHCTAQNGYTILDFFVSSHVLLHKLHWVVDMTVLVNTNRKVFGCVFM